MNHDFIERLEEIQMDFDKAIADGNLALADQLDMEMNFLIEAEAEEHEED